MPWLYHLSEDDLHLVWILRFDDGVNVVVDCREHLVTERADIVEDCRHGQLKISLMI
jgi:hypothetical protein